MASTSSKVPKGRHLCGDRVVYDIDAWLPGEFQPELEVSPIVKYNSDPALFLGRQIAVNNTYICYGLRNGMIRILNIHTALRILLKGLVKRVTDLVFFSKNVHLLASASIDGRIYVWKLTEGKDEDDKPHIIGNIVIAIQIVGEGESVHPRVCWHCHKQEVLVGIGKRVLRIDNTKVGKASAEEPLICHVDKLIKGVEFVGSHDGEVTDLSMCQWMPTRLVSASVDGTIKIWEDQKSSPIAVLMPHDGLPVNSVTFLTAPHRPDHIILITGGPMNHQMKIWVADGEEGWLRPSDVDSWRCLQTLELRSSSESRLEDAFFNQVVVLSQAGLLLLANAKKNAIYVVRLEYGPNPESSHMDYIAEFTVPMPILSFSGTTDLLPHMVKVYCLQTQAIQEYTLDISQCLPPPVDYISYEKQDSTLSNIDPSTKDENDSNALDVVSSTNPMLPSSLVPALHSDSSPLPILSSKVPKGRHLSGDSIVYDIDAWLPGEFQPQLEVAPIVKYNSDPALFLGRQIAVNNTYICYGLKFGAIRVLNINTALRTLMKGLAQRVTDMVFFSEDVHLLATASIDGQVYVWKLTEGTGEDDKPHIIWNIVIAIQIVGEGESVHPRVCWHCHKQEVLVVGIGKRVFRIDTTKVGRGSAEKPLICHVDKLIKGVEFVGSHDGEVTDLSMCQGMTTRLVSASVDGTIKIWEDQKSSLIGLLRPHDSLPVNSVTFLTAPHHPDHIILITGGPLNHEVKIWASDGQEGWLRPSDVDSWRCLQTLELRSSSESRLEDAFFNHVVVLSQAGLLLLANAKKNAIYVVHLEYGPNPESSHMDYIAEFTVPMPILSFTATDDLLPHIVPVYCVQTQAIQQYTLDMSQCLPPLVDNISYEKHDSAISNNAPSTEDVSRCLPHPIDNDLAVSGPT